MSSSQDETQDRSALVLHGDAKATDQPAANPAGVAAVGTLAVLEGLATAASIINSVKNIFEENELNRRIDEIFGQLRGLRQAIVNAVIDILEAIDGIRRQIDEDVANDNMALADRALFSDLAVFHDQPQAMGNSFEAANRLEREEDVVFLAPFIYVVNIRLAVLKDFDPSYFCVEAFQLEFSRYLDRLAASIADLNRAIRESHTVSVEKKTQIVSNIIENGETIRFWQASHRRDGVLIATFNGPLNDLSASARQQADRQGQRSRDVGIERDRLDLGVVAAEAALATWKEAFEGNLRRALVTQVLNRPVTANDLQPQELMVDGRVVSRDNDLRTTLYTLLLSKEFRRRIQRSWDALLQRGDDTLPRFAYRSLLHRDPTDDEAAAAKLLATKGGYAAFVASILYGDEYEGLHGRSLPASAAPSSRL